MVRPGGLPRSCREGVQAPGSNQRPASPLHSPPCPGGGLGEVRPPFFVEPLAGSGGPPSLPIMRPSRALPLGNWKPPQRCLVSAPETFSSRQERWPFRGAACTRVFFGGASWKIFAHELSSHPAMRSKEAKEFQESRRAERAARLQVPPGFRFQAQIWGQRHALYVREPADKCPGSSHLGESPDKHRQKIPLF